MLVSSPKENRPPATNENGGLNRNDCQQEESDKIKKTQSTKNPKVETYESNLQVKGPGWPFQRSRS